MASSNYNSSRSNTAGIAQDQKGDTDQPPSKKGPGVATGGRGGAFVNAQPSDAKEPRPEENKAEPTEKSG